MKKLFAVLLAAALLFALAACSNAGAEPADTPDTAEPSAQVTLPQTETEAPAALTDDGKLVVDLKTQLIGDWGYSGYDGVRLTFRDNGTGSYLGLDGAERSFLYLLSVAHEAYNNGEEYVNYQMSLKYDNGASEDVIIDLRENDGTELVLHNSEGGGYSGLIDFDVWGKE